ncbi:MAG: hypothetical protein CMC57_06775 [Flavobacteriaceae bacterium]|nr:hypothetical protein [Flavobacteriaceae bacterium]|tara:strand:+ start:1143 stop:1685 length:543 start_codon:yes stop_codon:yes gene_type:complete
MTATEVEYIKVIDQCRDLFEKKMKDYGSAWRILRISSLTDQIYIKAQRIRSLQLNKNKKIDEDEIPEFIGIINYSIMGLIQLEKGVSDKPDFTPNQILSFYNEKVESTFELMLAKNHDYGEAWRDMRITSLTDLIIQKLIRVKKIEENSGNTIVSEGIDANYQDIINYAVFALIHIGVFK